MYIDSNDMKQSDEFPGIGKKLPYREPVDFFEGLSEKTLEQAKLRKQNPKRILFLWRSIAVAASISALAILGYFIAEPEKPVNSPIVFEQNPAEQPKIKTQDSTKQPELAEIKNIIPEKVPEKIVGNENNTVEIGDVLADLSDEELLQLAAIYKADLFISESDQ